MEKETGGDVDFEASILGGEDTLQELRTGDIVEGEVIQITPEDVVVDVGLKGEGRVPRSELAEMGVELGLGDRILVKVQRINSEDGTARLSHKKALEDRRWGEVKEAFQEKRPVEGTITGEVKGGFKVDLGLPFKAFLPRSQATLRNRPPSAELIGNTYAFEVKELDRRRKNIVLSRRSLLEAEQKKIREEILGRINIGDILDGKVKNITNFGVFIDIGGIDGLVTLGDLSWSGFVKDASTVVKKGEAVKVKVLEFDPEAEPPRIRLGLKQAQGDPWGRVEEEIGENAILDGTVKSFTNFGVFVEILPGVDGLVHVSEISWTEHVNHPSDVLELGQPVRVKVLGVDVENRRISLSIKQALPDPWTVALDEYRQGNIVKGIVTGTTDFGAFVRLGAGVEGMIHKTDMSWDDPPPNPKEMFQVGQEVEVMILKMDVVAKKISLGYKQTLPDPWNEIARRYQKNSTVEAPVARVAPEGLFLALEEGVEGYVPGSELPYGRSVRPEEVYEEGQVVRGTVLRLDRKSKRITISIKQLQRSEEARDLKDYMSEQGESGGVTLGEMIGNTELARQLQEMMASQKKEEAEKEEGKEKEKEERKKGEKKGAEEPGQAEAEPKAEDGGGAKGEGGGEGAKGRKEETVKKSEEAKAGDAAKERRAEERKEGAEEKEEAPGGEMETEGKEEGEA